MKTKIKDLIGKFLYLIGVPCKVSTGIFGCITFGYGKLDNNGYWEYNAKTEDYDL